MDVKVVGVTSVSEEALGQCFHALGYANARARAKWARARLWQWKASDPFQLAQFIVPACDSQGDAQTFARILFEIEANNPYD